MPSRPKEVFISHSTRNNKFARQVHEVLARHGVPSFYGPKQISPGAEWDAEIGKALARCDWFVLVVSEQSLNSKWVKYEYHYAISKPQYEDRVVPLRWRKCKEVPAFWTLDQFQAVNFIGVPIDRGFTNLLALWGIPYTASKKQP